MIPIIPKRELMLIGGLYRDMSAMLAAPHEKLVARREGYSRWNALQQIRHVGLVNSAIFARLAAMADGKAEGAVATGGPKLLGWVVLTTGFIKRGAAKSPDPYIPEEECTREQAVESLEASKRALAGLASKLDSLPSPSIRFPHPMLGVFNGSQWLKFARIHTNHHVRIAEKVLG